MIKNSILNLIMISLILLVGFVQSWNVALLILNMCIISSIMSLGVNIQYGYAGLFNEIANNLEGKKSNEVNLYDGRKSIEFVTAVYKSFNEDKNIILPIEKESIYYKSWIPKKHNKN